MLNTQDNIQSRLLQTPKPRIQSIDVYRGIVISAMIIVDNQILDGFWFLNHARWNGLTPADLIFPAFLFIMGLAIPLSVKGPKPTVRPLFRSAIMFLIGFLLQLQDANFNFNEVRIFGVLQRLAICYALVSALHMAAAFGKYKVLVAIFCFVFSGLYYFLMVYKSEEMGCLQISPECNFGREVDLSVVPQAHMMRPTDPQGLVSTLTALVTTSIGYFSSFILLKYRKDSQNLIYGFSFFAILLLVLTYLLLLLQPLNKKIWSLSFMTLSPAVTLVSLSIVVFFIDFLQPKYRSVAQSVTRPFVWLGMNPLVVYVGMMAVQGLLQSNISWSGKSLGIRIFELLNWMHNNDWQSLVYSLLHLLLWLAVARALHNRKIFIRL